MNLKQNFYKKILDIEIDSKTKGINEINKIKVKNIPKKKWNIFKDNVQFPILTIKESIFKKNIESMTKYANQNGVFLAPHSKTSMCPQLLKKLNCWGFSVANNQQLSVLLEMGIKNIIIANLITNKSNITSLLKLVEKYRYSKNIYLCVDSLFGINLLSKTSIEYKSRSKIKILIETGFKNSRSGIRDLATLKQLTEKIIKLPNNFLLSGILFYEGAASTKNYKETLKRINKIIKFSTNSFEYLWNNNFFNSKEIILSGGGSEYFDLVVASFKKYRNIKNLKLVIRPGSFLAYGHGYYTKRLDEIDKRGGLFFNNNNNNIKATNLFSPSLELWAYIISIQDKNMAILNFGKRDVSFDLGYPVPLAIYRKSKLIIKLDSKKKNLIIRRLNDQHAFLDYSGYDNIQIGDLIKFGISHPCITIDKWSFFYMCDEKYNIKEALKTFF